MTNYKRTTLAGMLAGLALLGAGCSGTIAGDGRTSTDMGGAGGTDNPPVFDPDAPAIDPLKPVAPEVPSEASVSASPLVRLNPVELHNTLKDMFGPVAVMDYPFELNDSAVLTNPVAPIDAVRFFNLAESVADRVYKTPSVMVCTPGQLTAAACNEVIARNVGKRAFRRPLTAAEVTRFVTAAGAAKSFDDGVRIMVSAMLASAKFLYRVELDNQGVVAGTTRLLNHYETASRLSYALWQTMPDDELFTVASAGKLGTVEEVRVQAQRLLKSDRARTVVASFHGWWLRVEKSNAVFRDAKVYPGFVTGTTPAEWIDETKTFAERVVFDSDGSLVDLLSAPYTYAKSNVAGIYGGTADVDGRLSPTVGLRAGFLTQGALLAPYADTERTAAIHRGANLYRSLLCSDVPPPPKDVPKLDEDATASVRRQVELGTGMGECQSCHVLFNNMGFALGNYDGVGRWTDKDVFGHAIDTKVTLSGPGELEGVQIDGPVELGKAIGQSAALRDCYVDKWFEFLTGRPFDLDNGDQYSALSTQFEFETAKRDVSELLVQMVSSMAFRHVRTPVL